MELINVDTGEVIAEKVEVADSFWSRFRGLMFRRSFEEGEALLFELSEPKQFRIHTFFVFFSIDLVYLNDDFEVLEVEPEVPPFRSYGPEAEASVLVELPGGTVEGRGIEVGDVLEVQE